MDMKEMLIVLNPFYPLKFERLGTEDPKNSPSELISDLQRCNVGFADELSADEADYVNRKVYEAEALCSRYHRGMMCRDSDEAVSIAEKALSMSPICATALIMLGQYKAESFEEALDYFQKAEVAAKELVKGGIDFERVYEEKACWSEFVYRPYFRALHNQANTLLKMGKAKASYKIFQELFRLDPQVNTFSSYANFKVPALAAAVMTNQWTVVDKLMRMASIRELFQTQSSQIAYTWTGAYLLHKLRGVRNLDTKFYELQNSGGGEYELNTDSGLLLGVFNGPYFYKFITGQVSLPNLPDPKWYRHSRSPSNAAVMFKYVGSIWKNDSVALNWAVRNVNTAFLHTYANITPGKDAQVRQLKDMFCVHDLKYETYEKFCSNLESDTTIHQQSMSLVLELCVGRHCTPKHVRAAIKGGLNPNVNSGKMDAPLNFCAFQGLNEHVEMLLECGADPLMVCKRSGCSPLEFACNQGNVTAVRLMFKLRPDLRGKQKALKLGLESIFGTSVYDCITRGKPCQRCEYSVRGWWDKGHTRDPRDFERCILVLIENGLKVTSELRSECLSYPTKSTLYKFLAKYSTKGADLAQAMADLKM